jgi:hypothetical protein
VVCLVGLRLIGYGFKCRGLETFTGSPWLSSVSPGNRENGTLSAVGKIAKSDYLLHVMSCHVMFCLSNRREQLGSQWTDFPEISYLNICLKSAEKLKNVIKI